MGMKRMNRSRQWRNGAVAGRPKRLGRVTGCTQNRFAIRNDTTIQALRIETARREGFLIKRGMLRKLMLIVQAHNIQSKIAFRQAIP